MQALKLTPENIKTYYRLICAMFHSGAVELARNEVQRAKSVLTSEEYATLVNYRLRAAEQSMQSKEHSVRL